MEIIKKRAFTVMELMTVVVIVGVIAAFAIPKLTLTMDRAHEQDAVTQLTAIHAANKLYRAQNGTYWPPDATTYSLAQLNTALGLSIMANGLTYTCDGSDGSTFACRGTSTSGSFMAAVTEAALSVGTNPSVVNPCPAEYCN